MPPNDAPIDGTVAAPAAPSIVPADVMAAATTDTPAAPAAPGAPDPAAAPNDRSVDYSAEATDLVEFACALFTPIYPRLVPIYTADVRGRISGSLAPLMRKYGWSMAGAGPEIMAALTIVPLIVPTIAAVRADRAAEQASPAAVISNDRSNDNTIVKPGVTIEKSVDSPLARFPGQDATGAP